APRAKPVRGGSPVIQPLACSTAAALSAGASGSPENRVVALRSLTSPHSISTVSASSAAADHTATPNFTLPRSEASADSACAVLPPGRPAQRARNEASNAGRSSGAPPMISTGAPAVSASDPPHSHTMRRVTPSGVASRRVHNSGQACTRPGPMRSRKSARSRASFGVVVIMPLSRMTSRSRNSVAACIWSMAPPTCRAKAIAARTPAMSVPSPAITGIRLAPRSRAASPVAAASVTGLPRIQASVMSSSLVLLVVFDIGEALVLRGRAFQRAAGLAGLPVHDVLDLPRQFEILVGDALGGVILQPHLDPGIGCGDVGMVPRCLGEMADGVDHHQRAFPAMRAIFAADPAALVKPMRQLVCKPRLDFVLGVCAFLDRFGCHVKHLSSTAVDVPELPSRRNCRSLVTESIWKNPVPTRTLRSASLMTGPSSVTVTVPARLHFGFLDLNGGLGRRFGSIGLAVSDLRTRIVVSPAAEVAVTGPEAERARLYVERLRELLMLRGGCRVRVDAAAPSHAGLGSGTQLALAIAAGLRRLHGLPFDMRGDAIRLGRGGRSGIGIGLFDSGGVVVDGGRGASTDAAPIVSRMPFPEAWRIVLVLDPARIGVHGDDESAAFARLPPFAAVDAAHICRVVLMQALPALAESDLQNFAAAINEMQRLLGAYFAPLQGGHAFS